MIRLLILADPNSSHTIKWVKGLSSKGLNIYLFGTNHVETDAYKDMNNVTVSAFGYKEDLVRKRAGSVNKIKYLFVISSLKKIVSDFKPDLVHAHFATSYGLLASLLRFHPFIISVWGSDVYHFPTISALHRIIFKFNLSRADKILSTSRVMADEIGIYTRKKIAVTPFGIDIEKFKPEKTVSLFEKGSIVIGIIKTLEKWYGIDLLIEVFAGLKKKHPGLPLKLLIAGKGAEENSLKNLARSLGVYDDTVFTGRLSYKELSKYHNMIDIAVYPSLKESFGVSVLEASACEKPVIASAVGGHNEIVEDGITGILVPKGNNEALSSAIEKLLKDKELRSKLGIAARKKVIRDFNFEDNLNQMVRIYTGLLESGRDEN